MKKILILLALVSSGTLGYCDKAEIIINVYEDDGVTLKSSDSAIYGTNTTANFQLIYGDDATNMLAVFVQSIAVAGNSRLNDAVTAAKVEEAQAINDSREPLLPE